MVKTSTYMYPKDGFNINNGKLLYKIITFL